MTKLHISTNLDQSKFLLTGVVVSGGALILFSIVRTFFVGVFVCRMHQFPGILQKGQNFYCCLCITDYNYSARDV